MRHFHEDRFGELVREQIARETPATIVLDDSMLQLLGQKAAREFAAHRGIRLSRIESARLAHVGQRMFRKGSGMVMYLNDQCGFVIRYLNKRDEPREAQWWTQQEVSDMRSFTF